MNAEEQVVCTVLFGFFLFVFGLGAFMLIFDWVNGMALTSIGVVGLGFMTRFMLRKLKKVKSTPSTPDTSK